MENKIYVSNNLSSQQASTKQINFLKHLCQQQGIDFPFTSLKNTKKRLTWVEAGKAINSLKEGNSVIFVNKFPNDPPLYNDEGSDESENTKE